MIKDEKGLSIDTRNETEELENGIDLVAFALKLFDHWKRIAFFCVVAAVATFLFTKFFVAPKYAATSQIYVLSSSDSVVNLSDLQLGTYLASDYIQVFETREVCEQVASDLNLSYTPAELKEMMTIVNPTSTRILQITIESKDPVEAANLANAFSQVARKYIVKVMQTDAPTVLSEAVPDDQPISPSKVKNTILGFLICLLVCLAIELVVFITDTTVKSADDLTKFSGIPVFGQVPKIKVKRVSTVKKQQDAKADAESEQKPETEKTTEAKTEGELA